MVKLVESNDRGDTKHGFNYIDMLEWWFPDIRSLAALIPEVQEYIKILSIVVDDIASRSRDDITSIFSCEPSVEWTNI